jgi:hypothetical protein
MLQASITRRAARSAASASCLFDAAEARAKAFWNLITVFSNIGDLDCPH